LSGLERKIKRQEQKRKKKELRRDMNEKLGLYDRMEECCLVCQKLFDKKDKKMIQEWYVTVRDESSPVHLYCPACWDEGLKKIESLQSDNGKT
jgi:hypothetical protein